jgi:hypothetical protein
LSKGNKGGKPFLSLFSDLFKIKINIRDLFKISLFSDNPGDRRRNHQHQINSNNNSSQHGGIFVPLRLTEDQAAALLSTEATENEPAAIGALRAQLQERSQKR